MASCHLFISPNGRRCNHPQQLTISSLDVSEHHSQHCSPSTLFDSILRHDPSCVAEADRSDHTSASLHSSSSLFNLQGALSPQRLRAGTLSLAYGVWPHVAPCLTLVLQLREAKSLSTVKTVAQSDVKGDVQFANFSLMEVQSHSYTKRQMSHLRIVKRHPLHNAAGARPHGGTSPCPTSPTSFNPCSFFARRSWTWTALLPVRM